MRHALNKTGIMILSAAEISEMLQGIWISMTNSRKVLDLMLNKKCNSQ
jgi:hypothetical protein